MPYSYFPFTRDEMTKLATKKFNRRRHTFDEVQAQTATGVCVTWNEKRWPIAGIYGPWGFKVMIRWEGETYDDDVVGKIRGDLGLGWDRVSSGREDFPGVPPGWIRN